MKIASIVLAALIVLAGSGLAYYFATVELPVAAGEHDEHGEHGDEHGEEAHGHADENEARDPNRPWCDEHGAYEDECVKCNPGLTGKKADGDHAEDGHGEAAHAHGGEEHGHEDGAQHAEIDEARAEEHGIKLAPAESGTLQSGLTLPGEVALNANRVVHVVPRLTGVATQVLKNLGDTVTKGEIVAVIDSRELADVKSEYLAAIERRSLAQSRYSREKELFDKKISPAEDYLSARQALAEEEINIRSGEQKLQALGLTPDAIAGVRERRDKTLTDYTLVSPIDGTIIEKHLNTGEFVDEQADAFVIADMSQVWVSVVVYAADLRNIHDGQQVIVRSEDLALEATGEVAYIGALVGEQTRTAKATVELPNPEGLWRPGLFVSVAMTQEEFSVSVAVPSDAVQTLKNESVVFVREGDALEARPVKTGRSDGKHVEILDGLKPGEMFVSENSFLVKADIEKAGAAHEH
jgi:cobalt-zinc-cadmium efflux system membrane fusion protein